MDRKRRRVGWSDDSNSYEKGGLSGGALERGQLEAENAVEYRLYPPTHTTTGDSAAAQHSSLMRNPAELSAAVMALVHTRTSNHIWHKDPFFVAPYIGDHGHPILRGVTRFGDCLDDEWLIVFLLREITKAFPGLLATVNDNDGEFLLVESAKVLPTWLDPSSATNRVFVGDGRLHIVPIPRTPADLTWLPAGRELALIRALDVVLIHGSKTLASAEIESAAFEKANRYPELLESGELYHRARCVIPRDLARILRADPAVCALAVETFCTRDVAAFRKCDSMSRFSPSTNVQANVRLTRTMFAQLACENVRPPKPFRIPPKNDPNYSAHELGMKLACGFEMLVSDRHLLELLDTDKITLESYQFEIDPLWRIYKERLKLVGYFRSEREGSKMWKELEHLAKIQHIDRLKTKQGTTTVNGEDLNVDEDALRGPAALNPLSRVLSLLANAPDDLSDTFGWNDPADSDEWLTLDPSALEKQLMESGYSEGPDGLTLEDLDDDEAGARRMDRAVKSMGSFVEMDSGLNGALFPDEAESDTDDTDNEAEADAVALADELEDPTKPVRLDSKKFMRALTSALGIDESVLKPKREAPKGSSARAAGSGKPLKLPDNYEATDVLRRQPGTTQLFDSDDEQEVFGRRGLQEEEEDSDDEAATLKRWERMILNDAESTDHGPHHDGEHRGGVGGMVGIQEAMDEDDVLDATLEEYMAAMDRELFKTKIGRDFVREGDHVERSSRETQDAAEPDTEEGAMREVDIGANLVKNLLDGMGAQGGLPGPATNLLGRMGLRLPRPSHDANDAD